MFTFLYYLIWDVEIYNMKQIAASAATSSFLLMFIGILLNA